MKVIVKIGSVIATLLVLAFGPVLVGCETTKGVGKDIQNASTSTENAIKGN